MVGVEYLDLPAARLINTHVTVPSSGRPNFAEPGDQSYGLLKIKHLAKDFCWWDLDGVVVVVVVVVVQW